MRQPSRVVLPWLLLLAAGGCSTRREQIGREDTDSGAPDGAAGPDQDAVTEDDGEAADGPAPQCLPPGGVTRNPACNDLVATGPCVARFQIADSAPVPGGGTLAAGTYDLTERILYTNPGGANGPAGEPGRETVMLESVGQGWTLSRATLYAGTPAREVVAVTVTNSQVRMEVICPPPAEGTPRLVGNYTATDQSLTIYFLTGGGPVQADTYARR